MKTTGPKLVIYVTGTIIIDAKEAEILEHITSYAITKTVASSCSNKYSEANINNVLIELRQQLHAILALQDETCKLLLKD